MTYEQWLHSRYAPDDCYGCKFNDPLTAHCSFKNRYCYFYIDFNRVNTSIQLNLFDEDG